MKNDAQYPLDCSPGSLRLECGPVQPAQALGGKFVDLAKKLIRFIILLPKKTLEWGQSFTLVTFCTVLFLIAMQMIASLSFLDVKSVCLSTVGITKSMQVYRLFTYSHFHSSLPHMLLNVIFLSSYGKTIERSLGSYYLFNVVMIFTTSCAIVQMLLELFISLFYPPVLDDCISGYSGILFGVLVLALGVTVNKSDTSSYCLGYVPRGLYPLVILLLIQLVTTEQISIIANLAGIITGYAYMHDLFNFVKLTPNMIFTLEHAELCHMVNTLPGFVHYPRDKLLPDSNTSKAKHNRTTTKRDTSTKLKCQNGHFTPSEARLDVPSKVLTTEKELNGSSSERKGSLQSNPPSENVPTEPTLQISRSLPASSSFTIV